jgi:ubiquinone/menaquinone biosynthesis C-methylase UbiE
LGCGPGIVGLVIKKYFQAEVLGADVADQRTVDLPFQLIDGKTLPFPDNFFDTIYIAHVLHHTENYLNLLEESKRVSKDKIIIYEDLPEGKLSSLFCQTHGFLFNIIGMFNREKTYFKKEETWMEIFKSFNLQVIHKKRLKVSRFYPIKYIQFVLQK